MAKLTRALQKLFGSNASSNQLAKFGSLAAGVPVRYSGSTVTPGDIQALANFLTGWNGAVIGSNSPAIEDMNSLFYLTFYQLAYQFQAGVAEYDASTTYYIGSLVNDGTGILYKSLTNTNVGNALTDATNWQLFIPGISWNTQTGNYTLLKTDDTVGFITVASAIDATLPTAVGIPGKRFVLKKTDTGTGYVRVLTTSSQTIDQFASGEIYLFYQGEAIEIVSNGANYEIVSRKNTTLPAAYTVTITGSTSNPTKGTTTADSGTWYKDGKYIDLRYDFQQSGAGANGSGNYLFSLPSGLVIDSTYINLGGNINLLGACGEGMAQINSNSAQAIVQAYNTTNIGLLLYNTNFTSVNLVYASSVTTGLGGTNTSFSFNARLPIVNWS